MLIPETPSPDRALTVSQLVARLAGLLDAEPDLQDLAVRGEISGWKRYGSGHCYFSLKDAESQIRCVLFAGDARWLRFAPEDGVQVLVRGRATVYEPRGELQIRVRRMEPDGQGALHVALEKLRQRLAAEGLFAEERKRPLPPFPRVVGLVTSEDGAVLHDIRTTLERRNPAVQVLLAPSAVQGPKAEGEIVAALRRLERCPSVECIIVGRGGGSLEDLMAFNSESVVRAVAGCRVPVISAVGHESDYTLCDLVADRRAPTPTAAAELVAPDRQGLLKELDTCRLRLRQALLRRLRLERERLARLQASPAVRFPLRRAEREAQALDDLSEALHKALATRLQTWRREVETLGRLVRLHHPRARLDRDRRELEGLARRLGSLGRRLAGPRKERLQSLRISILRAGAAGPAAARVDLERLLGRLQALSPLRVLDRGYAVVTDHQGHVLLDAANAAPGQSVRVRLRVGAFRARVERVEEGSA